MSFADVAIDEVFAEKIHKELKATLKIVRNWKNVLLLRGKIGNTSN